jgi:hypothetical protein
MITYDGFAPPQVMGVRELVLDDALLRAWHGLFHTEGADEVMPHGMVAAITMRAYTDILQPRPPGNVHAAQRFDLLRLPRRGERLTTTVSCLGKEIRKGRRWVTFGIETSGTDGPAFRGRTTMIWAA